MPETAKIFGCPFLVASLTTLCRLHILKVTKHLFNKQEDRFIMLFPGLWHRTA